MQKTGIRKEELILAVGHDSRMSAERLKNALLSVFAAEGVKKISYAASIGTHKFTEQESKQITPFLFSATPTGREKVI